MSKIYEALQYAHAESLQATRLPIEDEPPIIRNFPKIQLAPDYCNLQFGQEMRILEQSISWALGNHEKKVIQFIGSQPGEGTSTIVREFAKVSAENGSQSVLIIDADAHHLTQHQTFGINLQTPLSLIMADGGDLNQAVSQVGKSKLFLSAFFSETTTKSTNSLFFKADGAWGKIRQRFDLILIDSPAFSASVDGIDLCAMVDGVVLVIEAERTRSPVTKETKERIRSSGGNLLGIVFNKHRHYLPEWIYKKL